MYSSTSQQLKKYEDYAFVLDFVQRGKSMIIKDREGPLIQGIGEDRLTLLEILAEANATFRAGERIPIGKDNRVGIVSVLGRLDYSELTGESRNRLESVLESMIKLNEKRYVQYFNDLQPVTPRLHSLELIPGIGKTFMRQIVNQRERKKFESFEDLEKRTGIRSPAKLISRRIVEELSGGSKIAIFVRR